jgi:predicted XRE-type DNA-binding protein
MSKKRFANVWDAIEDTPAQAENMKLRSALMMALKDHIARTGLSQSKAAKLLGVTQPRISDLTRGKIELFSLDTLVNMIGLPACMLKCGSRTPPDRQRLPYPVRESRLVPQAGSQSEQKQDNSTLSARPGPQCGRLNTSVTLLERVMLFPPSICDAGLSGLVAATAERMPRRRRL